MVQKITNLYSFNELSKESQEKAINNYRNDGRDYLFYYDDIISSVKKVIELFGLKTGNQYDDIRTSHIDDDILNLSGVRLYKYLVNHYYSDLFKPKYIKTLDGELYYRQFICKRYKGTKGMHTQIFSRMKVDNCCVLTGCCYDDDILKPIYDFLAKINTSITLEDLFNDIESAISKCFTDTEEWTNSDEFIIEEIESNSYTFTEDGEIENI